ncbi:MAG: hypothetical protein AAGB31_14035, partial [Bdellovibrio sp.]
MKIAVLIAALGMTACVSKSKHEEAVKSLNEEIAREKGQVEVLSAERAKLENNLIATAKDRGQLKAALDEMKTARDEMRQRQEEQARQLRGEGLGR